MQHPDWATVLHVRVGASEHNTRTVTLPLQIADGTTAEFVVASEISSANWTTPAGGAGGAVPDTFSVAVHCASAYQVSFVTTRTDATGGWVVDLQYTSVLLRQPTNARRTRVLRDAAGVVSCTTEPT